MQMSELEKKIDARIANAIGHKLTDEENAYVKGVADGMVFSRQLKEHTPCSAEKSAKG